MIGADGRASDLQELRDRKRVFDTGWWLVVCVAAAAVLLPRALELITIDIAPAVTLLAAVGAMLGAVGVLAGRCESPHRLQTITACVQVGGLSTLALTWYVMGGLQNPTFAVFVIVPLLLGPVVLNTWQQYLALAVTWSLLLLALPLSPDVAAFVFERYGLNLGSAPLLRWLPRSRSVFAQVSTSPAFDLLMLGTLLALAGALHATSTAIAKVAMRARQRLRGMQAELAVARRLNDELIARSLSAEVLVSAPGGKIVHASERFCSTFALDRSIEGRFLLDVIDFHYPDVVKRLIAEGGEEVQGAQHLGHQVVLCVRAATIELADGRCARLNIEPHEEAVWRGALEVAEDAIVAVDSRDSICFMNPAAAELLGADRLWAHAGKVLQFEEAPPRWWAIAPLHEARRSLVIDRRRFMIAVRRRQSVAGVGALTFLHLRDVSKAQAYAPA